MLYGPCHQRGDRLKSFIATCFKCKNESDVEKKFKEMVKVRAINNDQMRLHYLQVIKKKEKRGQLIDLEGFEWSNATDICDMISKNQRHRKQSYCNSC